MHAYVVRPHVKIIAALTNFRYAAIRSAVVRRTNATSNAIGYAKFTGVHMMPSLPFTMQPGNVIETHNHAGDFKEW
jgi:hypothetical protein